MLLPQYLTKHENVRKKEDDLTRTRTEVEVEQAMELKVAVAQKPLTGWSYLAGSGHKTEEEHQNIEKLTALIGYNANVQ